jgi:methylglyoxal/glyoxal reductase
MIEQPYTKLSNGIKMPLLGLGVYDMHGDEAEQAVQDALKTGYRLIDTAALYNNETAIGNAVKKSGIPREQIFVTTKVGDSDQGYDSTLRAYDTSLKKLQMDYADLYLIHWPIKAKRKDTWLALEKLYADKRVKAIGVANYLIPFLEELKIYASIMPMLNQVEFTPWLFQQELVDYCAERNMQLQSYSPITRAQKFNDARLVQLCDKYGKSPAQIILRWNIERGISTIPKSANKKRLQENFDTLQFTLLKEDVAFMDGFDEQFRICENPMDLL